MFALFLNFKPNLQKDIRLQKQAIKVPKIGTKNHIPSIYKIYTSIFFYLKKKPFFFISLLTIILRQIVRPLCPLRANLQFLFFL